MTMPLKLDIELGRSRPMALQRLYSQENKFKKNPEFKAKYHKFMDEYEQLGHMRLASPLAADQPHYYLPHHAVAIERKFRVVFDGSAKTSNGRSLNDIQYTGPRLQKDLAEIVMKFRTGRVAISADICKMFRQVEIEKCHWNYQRIVWRKDPRQPIRDYWLTVVTYGEAASPYPAVKALQRCAYDNAAEMPMVSQVVLKDFYMDDLMTAVENEEEGVQLKSGLVEMLRRGGFELAKWRSNNAAIAEEIEESKVVEDPDSTSVLGLIWNFVSDTFQFKVHSSELPDVITKRYITSEAAKIFDPQGWLLPFTILAKLFIQSCWKKGIQWDDALPTDLKMAWIQFHGELARFEFPDGSRQQMIAKFKFICLPMRRLRHMAWLPTYEYSLREIGTQGCYARAAGLHR